MPTNNTLSQYGVWNTIFNSQATKNALVRTGKKIAIPKCLTIHMPIHARNVAKVPKAISIGPNVEKEFAIAHPKVRPNTKSFLKKHNRMSTSDNLNWI